MGRDKHKSGGVGQGILLSLHIPQLQTLWKRLGENKLRYPIIVILISLLVPQTVYAQNNQVQRGPVPNWVIPSELMPVPANASGLVFVRRQETLIHLDDKGQAQYTGYRIKLLHPNALQIGNISIDWNPASGAPTVHVIKVYRDGQIIDVLQQAKFEILRREGQLEAAMLNGILTAVFRITDLRVGDELEFGMTTRVSDPTLGKNDSGFLFLGAAPPPGRFRLGLSWNDGQKPTIKMTTDLMPIATTGDGSIEFRFDNIGFLVEVKGLYNDSDGPVSNRYDPSGTALFGGMSFIF